LNRSILSGAKNMIYALNLYDFVPGKENVYKEYITEASKATVHLNGIKPVLMGQNPIKELKGKTRSHFVIAEFPDIETFDQMMEVLEENDIHRLREEATKNYIWTIFEPWDMERWMQNEQ